MAGFFYQAYDASGDKVFRHPRRLLSVTPDHLIFAGRSVGDPESELPTSMPLRLRRLAICPGDLLTFVDRSPGSGPGGRTGQALVTDVNERQLLLDSDKDLNVDGDVPALRFAVKFHANLRYTDLTNMSYRQVSARKNLALEGTATLLPRNDSSSSWRLVQVDATFVKRPTQRVLLVAAAED